MKTTLATISATLVCTALFAGCGSSDDSSGDTTGQGGSATAGSGGSATAGSGGTTTAGTGGTGSSGKGGSAGGTAGTGGSTGGSGGTAGAGGSTGGAGGSTGGAGGSTGGTAGAGGSTGGAGGSTGGAGGSTGGSAGTAGAGGSTGGSAGAAGTGGAGGGTAPADVTCLGSIPADPKPADPTITFDFTVLDFLSKTPISMGAVLKACLKTDTACNTPVDTKTTDATGKVTFSFNAGPDGFDGYIDTSGVDKHQATLVFLPHHVIGNPTLSKPPAFVSLLFPSSIYTSTKGTIVTAPDPSRGDVVNVVHDCSYALAAGVSAAVSTADAQSKTAYAKTAVSLDATATQTNGQGAAFIFNVPSGPATVTDTIGGKTLAAANVFVRAATLSDVSLYPLPLN
jgi:hypothetical protein